MANSKNLGIWMDHASAHLMELLGDSIQSKVITSTFTHDVKETTQNKSEHIMHNKEQHQQLDYFKKIAECIRDYNDVILFGPTDAKVELHNLLKTDHLFEKINIEVKQADKMTENQQHAFVKEYFARSLKAK